MKQINVNVEPTDIRARIPTGIRPYLRVLGSGSMLYGGGKYSPPSTCIFGEYGAGILAVRPAVVHSIRCAEAFACCYTAGWVRAGGENVTQAAVLVFM